MFEVYLNIIEMGPGIYGVSDAARFYFDKDVSKLSLSESVFMASIVPRPKWFKYSFDKNGRLRDFLYPYYELMGTKMLAKGFISEQDKQNLIPDIRLKGPARLSLMQNDSLELDSLQILLPELRL
jgi:membrane peptidoglycan carboxypeptidase